jgi:alpha-mannosidase
MSLTLIRSSYDPDPVPEVYKHTFKINVGLVDNASPRSLIEASLRQNRTAKVVACGSQTGALPPTGQFLKVQGDGAVVSSVKMAEDGDGLIVRCYNTTDKDAAVAVAYNGEQKPAAAVDVHENAIDAQPICRAYGAITLKVVV